MIGMEDGVRMLSAAGRRFSRCAPSPRPRRNYALANIPPPAAVHIRTNDMISPEERRFLEAAELGNKPTLQECLDYDGDRRLNVNCLDSMGRTALEIAVDNENMEVVELLLQQPDIRIGNALLCAIREGVYRLVEVLVNHPNITREMLGDGWSQALDPSEAASAEYSSDISPVILAAQLNQFEILQMLIRKDASIEKPHRHSCICETCDRERLNDSLQYSLKRINTFRALASPAWMSLTSPDPILSAFKLSWDLQRLAFEEHEFKETYLQLSEQCKQYSCDLLSQCRSSEEVIAILNKDGNVNDDNIDVWASKLSLSRLKLAIKYEQKAFVSHPHCQQLLTSIWYEGIPYRQRSGTWANFFLYAFLLFLWPIFCLMYILMPKSRLGRLVRSPFMKFFYYSVSFATFLGLLTWATFEDYRYEKGERGGMTRASDRGPPATWVESLVFTWVIGMLWSEIKQLWEEGFKRYMRQWWNWLDFLMICLYLCTISIRLSAYYIFTYREDPYRYTVRTYWTSEEPMLVAEALFAVGNVFSFARIIYLFQTNPYLGPLQISLGCMLVDVAKFCFIFVLIISSFSIGLAQLYWYYDPNTDVCLPGATCKHSSNVFSSIADSYLTLLWSLFSITKPEDTDVVENHKITQWVGQGMFIMYHCTSIIVLLNMLIAMMSHSFQIINDHADLEWKFHRTKLWMAHFDEGSSLPPPFNIIVTPKSLIYVMNCLFNTVRWLLGKYTYQKNRNRATIRRPGYSRKRNEMEKSGGHDDDSLKPLTYADIITRLVARFIHQTKKDMKMDGVNEDDLHEIKQDISSLRYELRDDRRREIVRSSSHIDAVKRDIMRTMSTTSRRPYGGSMRLPKTRPSVAEESEEDDKSDETSSTDEEADETRSRKSSVLYIPPVNSTLPGIISEEAPVKKSTKRRASEADSKLPDRPLSDTYTSSFTPKLLPVFAQPPHSALRKTDTSMSFPINGTALDTSIVKPPRGVLRASQENLPAVELIETLKKEMNEKLDRLISGISENVKSPSPASHSHVGFNVEK
ncbi:Transient receptor ion channel domain-containing protein [Caenorhabditis elegans]|uniref:Transient receptor ion channel domain-containing protein n=1 Tax=Caenorhabditis elegans TaxID=6239 RepID=Q27GV1_CAEEL|nr:Transient receptor ion channel domain-containing protein [Caenorhabditis elegans]CCD62573.2 Transient receptor ion channel domain-containing protein [Caenorhabditis elegans]